MQLILEILIRGAEILTIVAGSAGILVSILLMLSPGSVWKISRALDTEVISEKKLAPLNPSLNTESFVLKHHAVCGGILVACSIFILLFLSVRVQAPVGFGIPMDMAIEFSILLGLISGMAGLVTGTLLFFSPAVFRTIGQKLNIWIDTGPAFNKLDSLSVNVDPLFLKHPLVSGLVGLVVSTALIIVSVANFLGTSTSLGRGF